MKFKFRLAVFCSHSLPDSGGPEATTKNKTMNKIKFAACSQMMEF